MMNADAPDQAKDKSSAARLADMSIEQLMNESVTSVSKRETKLADSPAAITVITSEDIRRIGATTIPEALRIVPGLDVGRINSSEWAVSSRGFNNQYGNKLLVLVDGRSVYTPSFAGVYWHMEDLMLEDLDRIEVIRGPGATLWGANAVNGVINITTKSARDTQGFLSAVTYGSDLEPLTSMRYGGQLASNLYYRVYGQYLNHDNFVRSDGRDVDDDWNSARGGVRLDWYPSDQNHFTLQGDYNNQQIDQPFNEARLVPVAGTFADTAVNKNYSANVLGRWTHTFSPTSEGSLQFYYDTFRHADAESVEYRDTVDLDWQHRIAAGERNEIVWGFGYRYSPDDISTSESISYSPQQTHHQFANAFVQDEIKLVPDKLSLTLGTKLEHNDYTGFEVEPSARLLWNTTEKQTTWAAVSRATRTPSRFEADSRLDYAAFPTPFGPTELAYLPADKLRSEELLAYELGYRVEPGKDLAIDVAGFYNIYDHLQMLSGFSTNFEAAPPPGHNLVSQQWQFANSGETYGVELQGQWRPTEWWRLTAGYTWLHMRLHPDQSAELDNPQHQFNVRSYIDITRDLEFNSAAYYVDQTSHLNGPTPVKTPGYVRLDLGVTWRPTKNLEMSLWGQNLLNDRHSEFISYHASFLTEVPRSVVGRVSLHF